MKKYPATLIFLVIFSLSCKKKADPQPEPAPATPAADLTPPVITLSGKQLDTCYLGNTYSDPGATATDNIDGNITPSILVTGTVNSAVTGTYLLNYNVKDAANNNATQVARTVRVLNNANFLAGSYAVVCTYTVEDSMGTPTITTSNYAANVQVSSSANNSFTISTLKIGPVNVVPLYTTLTNNSINLMYQNTAYPFGTASGTLSASKTSFTVNTYSYEQMFPSRTHTCKNVFTKQ